MTKARDLANAGTALTLVSATELGYLDGVTSAVQTQLNTKAPLASPLLTGDVGINVSSPGHPIHAQSSGTSTTVGGNVVARLQSNGSGYDSTILLSDNVANSATMSMLGGATVFRQNGTESMRIAANTNVGIGKTPSYKLDVNGTVNASALYVNGSPLSGGKVLQVVAAYYGTSVSSSSTTYIDSGLTATITPSSTSSKVLVLVSQNGCVKSSNSLSNGIGLRLLRDSTSLIGFAYEGLQTDTGIVNKGGFSTGYLDSPATTSAVTYKTQLANTGANAASVSANQNASSSIILLEIGA